MTFPSQVLPSATLFHLQLHLQPCFTVVRRAQEGKAPQYRGEGGSRQVPLCRAFGVKQDVGFVGVQKAFAQLLLAHKPQPDLCPLDLATVVHVLVTAHLDYCNTLCVGLPLKMVQKVQLVQNGTAYVATEA